MTSLSCRTVVYCLLTGKLSTPTPVTRAALGWLRPVIVVGSGSPTKFRTKEERLADLLRYGPKPPTATPRARSALQAYSVANKLSSQVLLTYESPSRQPIKDLRALMKRSRRRIGGHPWLAVPEYGSLG